MAKQFDQLFDKHIEFIEKQKIYFVATAATQGRINLSPKGLDSLRVIDSNTIHWLNLTGSGNETAAHLLEDSRMTIMFCSFDAAPLILRLYGRAEVVHKHDEQWQGLYQRFEGNIGARQIFKLNVDLVQTSCGYGVPNYSFDSDKQTMFTWAKNKGEDGVEEYWQQKNTLSIDGKPTGI